MVKDGVRGRLVVDTASMGVLGGEAVGGMVGAAWAMDRLGGVHNGRDRARHARPPGRRDRI